LALAGGGELPLQRDWLDDGSLLMLLPEALLGEWHGVATGDYERACGRADSWLAPLPIADGLGLLLGGDPGMALILRDDGGRLILVRWQYAVEEEELVEFALRGESVAATEPDLVIWNERAAWIMFDSAADPVADRPLMRSFDLPVTRVRVATSLLKSERDAAIVHVFRPDV
jgi:hypothetical protein